MASIAETPLGVLTNQEHRIMNNAIKAIVLGHLQAEHHGEICDEAYRAVLINDKNSWLVRVEQQVRGEWSVCGRWNLSTLLFGFPVNMDSRPLDSLSIDFGQRWSICSGMRAALKNAIEYI